MKVFLKMFLVGVVFALIMFILIPCLVEGVSPGYAIAKMTNNSLKVMNIIQVSVVCGIIWGGVFSLISWAVRRNREKKETDDLMREYLKKKLQEENEKQ